MNKEKTNKVLDYFEELFPDAHCELNHQNVFELLVAVMLSAQTTDKKVNQVTASLFKKYPTVESFALASLEDLQNDIKIIGLYRNKAKNLKKMAQVLLEEYNGEVPKTRNHHRDCRAALQHRRDRSPRQHAPHRAAGHSGQQAFQAAACRCFQTVAERIHAV